MNAKPYPATGVVLALGLGVCASSATAGPKVVTQCQTLPQPGAYVLGKNLNAAGGKNGVDCLLLAEDFISIDLNGFTITGSGAKGTGIKLADEFGGGGRGFDIRGGTIISFARGIDLRVLGGSPGQNRLERMRIQENSDFGAAMSGSAIVRDSIFVKNGVCNLLAGCPPRTTNGDGLNVGRDSVVTGNTASGNGGHGLSVAGGTVSGNTADGNGDSGLAVGGGTVVHNTAGGNAVGISVSCPSAVVGNTAIGNSSGNLLPQGAGCDLVDNVAP